MEGGWGASLTYLTRWDAHGVRLPLILTLVGGWGASLT